MNEDDWEEGLWEGRREERTEEERKIDEEQKRRV